MPTPARVGDDPLEADVVALLGGEGPEIMTAFHQLCRRTQEIEIEFLRREAGEVAPQGGPRLVVYQVVLVGTAPGIPTGVELVGNGYALAERDVSRQDRRALVRDQGRPELSVGAEGGDLPTRVHAGVRAAGDAQLDLLAQNSRERFGECALDRPPSWLGGPSGERGAFVLDEPGEVQSRIPTSRISTVTASARASLLPKRSSR